MEIVKRLTNGTIVRVPYSTYRMAELIDQLYPDEGDPIVDDYYIDGLHEPRPEWD